MNKVLRKILMSVGLYDKATDLKDKLKNKPKHYEQFYTQFMESGDLCFDVGANVGRRTEVLLGLGARVVAVEPQFYCINILRKKFETNKDVILVEAALGAEEGQSEMLVSDTHSLSTLSGKWIDSVRKSGRYNDRQWDKTIQVKIRTLDALIEEHGKPVFLKVDVEGYEDHVFKGLSSPVKYICFEYTPEFIDIAVKSIKHLAEIGSAEFNYTNEEDPFKLVMSEWVGLEDILKILESLQNSSRVGDLYVRYPG